MNINFQLNSDNFSQGQTTQSGALGPVLVINDSVLETYYIIKVIEKASVTAKITAKKNIWEALEFLQQEYNEKRPLPRLIFLDMQMPGLNGFDFLEAFQQLPETIQDYCRIIVVNGSEEKPVHDSVMSFRQVKYYLTSSLSFELMDKLCPLFIRISGNNME